MKCNCVLFIIGLVFLAHTTDAKPSAGKGRAIFDRLPSFNFNLNNLQKQLQNELKKLLEQPVRQPLSTNTIQLLKVWFSLRPFLPELTANLATARTTNEAIRVVNDWIQKLDPTIDVNKLLLQYLKENSPQIYMVAQFSFSIQQTLNVLIPILEATYQFGNQNDPMLYVNLLELIINSGILNPSTPSVPSLPDIPIPGIPDILAFENTILKLHLNNFIPTLMLEILNAKTNLDIANAIERTLKVHITPEVVALFKSELAKVDPALYEQIKNINDIDILYPLMVQSLGPFMLQIGQQFAAGFGINLPDLTPFFLLPDMNVTDAIVYDILSQILFNMSLNEINSIINALPDAISSTLEQGIKMSLTPEVITIIKESIALTDPNLYELFKNINTIDAMYVMLAPFIWESMASLAKQLQISFPFTIPTYPTTMTTTISTTITPFTSTTSTTTTTPSTTAITFSTSTTTTEPTTTETTTTSTMSTTSTTTTQSTTTETTTISTTSTMTSTTSTKTDTPTTTRASTIRTTRATVITIDPNFFFNLLTRTTTRRSTISLPTKRPFTFRF